MWLFNLLCNSVVLRILDSVILGINMLPLNMPIGKTGFNSYFYILQNYSAVKNKSWFYHVPKF